MSKIDELRKMYNENNDHIKPPDDSRVVIAQMQFNAIEKLSSDENQAFSQLSMNEVFDVSRAYVFAANPLPSLENRLKEKGIQIKFSLPILTNFLDENMKHRHKIDRKRVDEYIKGLEAVSPRQNNIFQDEKKTLLQKLG